MHPNVVTQVANPATVNIKMKRKATFVITVSCFNRRTIIEKPIVAHSQKPQEALNLAVTEERY
jgi:hypothetical protein